MEKDKVSIVIPIYNGEKYLTSSLDSAVNQTYDNIEIIAINDGSSDNSLDILKEYEDKITILTKKNGGTGSALNTGIRKMNGQWLKWLSQDDILYPNSVEKLIEASNEVENKKQWIFVSNYERIDSAGNVLKRPGNRWPEVENNFDFNVVLLHHYFGNVNSSLIHKSALDDYGLFDERPDIPPDYELWLRYCLLYNVKLFYLPEILLKYRKHQESFSAKTSKKEWEIMNSKIKNEILEKIDPTERQKYNLALQLYKKFREGEKRNKIKKYWEKIRECMVRIEEKQRKKSVLTKEKKFFHYDEKKT